MSVLLADDPSFGVSASAAPSANSKGLLAAIAAAANDHTLLILPQGRIQYDETLVLPAGFTGSFAMCGLEPFTTSLCPVPGVSAFDFDMSAEKPALNFISMWDFGTLLAPPAPAAAVAPFAGRISWGAAGVPSTSDQVLARLMGLYFKGGGWSNGLVLEESWNGVFGDLFFFGSETTYANVAAGNAFADGKSGAGTGKALSIIGGVNNTFRDLRVSFFAQGVSISSQRGAGGDPQGVYFDGLSMVEVIEPVHGYGTPGGNLSTVQFKGHLVLDNGNINVAANASRPGHRGIVLENAEDSTIGSGQILQDGGDSAVIFNSCKRCTISDDLNLSDRSNTTGPAVQDNGGSGNDLGKNPPSASQLVNISTRGFVGTGGNIMIGGFVIAGATPKQVLIRASGPAIGAPPFNVPGVLPDPKLVLLSGSSVVGQNQGWGGSAQISAAAAGVGAFPWTNPASLDAALLVTLQPGSYTAEVTGASGDTGDCLLEIYEIP